MYSQFSTDFNDTPEAREAQDILRRCVHCGFCNATCPTYQLNGNELDGPRGRIYLIKQMFEGNPVAEQTQLHLDRCLSCLSCETTCPSGVEFGRLADIGRHIIDQKVSRPWPQRLFRRVLLWWLPYPKRFTWLVQLARVVRPLLPTQLKTKIPVRQPDTQWPQSSHTRKVLLLDGCVQQSLAPKINASTARVLDQLEISVVRVPNAQQLNGVTETLLTQLGFILTPVDDAHLCCGSAGTYSLLQVEIADQLRTQKLDKLQQNQPELIATANIGCLLYLQEKSNVPVVHWIELLDH